MAKKSSGGGLSLRTKDAVDGGGTEGALATISEIGFVDEFTYGGRFKDSPSAALHVVFDIEGFNKPWDQHYSVGPSDKYEVIADGDGIKSLGKAEGLNRKCPAFGFIAALEEAAGTDIDDLMPELDEGGNSVRPLEGKRVRLTNVKFETVGGDMKEYVVIAAFVDDASRGKAGKPANGKATTTSSAKASFFGDIEEKTVETIKDLIEEHTSVKKNDLANLVYAVNRKDPDAKAMMQIALKQSWIADEDRPWSFDAKKGILRAAE